MSIGIPLGTRDGGFLFVFQTGAPMFRKYSRDGRIEFERHIQGPELDARVLALPTVWPPRAAGSKPVVPPMVRAAALDRDGRLWISLTVPYTYVYNEAGEKSPDPAVPRRQCAFALELLLHQQRASARRSGRV